MDGDRNPVEQGAHDLEGFRDAEMGFTLPGPADDLDEAPRKRREIALRLVPHLAVLMAGAARQMRLADSRSW